MLWLPSFKATSTRSPGEREATSRRCSMRSSSATEARRMRSILPLRPDSGQPSTFSTLRWRWRGRAVVVAFQRHSYVSNLDRGVVLKTTINRAPGRASACSARRVRETRTSSLPVRAARGRHTARRPLGYPTRATLGQPPEPAGTSEEKTHAEPPGARGQSGRLAQPRLSAGRPTGRCRRARPGKGPMRSPAPSGPARTHRSRGLRARSGAAEATTPEH